jgi:hypothetical protein
MKALYTIFLKHGARRTAYAEIPPLRNRFVTLTITGEDFTRP